MRLLTGRGGTTYRDSTLASPRGTSWPFSQAVPHFVLSSACFALYPAVSALSHSFHFPLWMTFVPHLRINSATASLPISWAFRRKVRRVSYKVTLLTTFYPSRAISQ